jgi:large subunit ribosomal protein L22
MAFGVKTNERPGVRAQVRYVRVSPYKAREVLNLIRGQHVGRALEILEFTERDVAKIILKALESAIANAEHNNGIPADELYVSACYADEGPTLKRFRPRARGRAARIRKRTSHITVIVSRLSAEELKALREREAMSGRARGNRAAAEARRERVARSRQAKADKRAAEEAHEHEHADEHDHDERNQEEGAVAGPVGGDELRAEAGAGGDQEVEQVAEPTGEQTAEASEEIAEATGKEES